MIRYLFTGVPRSGTGYMAQVLKSAGVACGHEAIFSHGGLESAQKAMKDQPELIAESSWLAVPFLDSDLLKETSVIQVIRHPLRTIESMIRVDVFSQKPYIKFMYKHLPRLGSCTSLENMATYFYLEWSARIEEYASLAFRVENDPVPLLKALDIKWKGDLFSDRTYNSRQEYQGYELDVENIASSLYSRLKQLIRNYGYSQ